MDRSLLGLKREILAAIGSVALLSGCASDDGNAETGGSEGSTSAASGASGSSGESGGSMSSTSAGSGSASGGSTGGGSTSAGTTSGASTSGSSGPGTTDPSTGTTGLTSTTGTTGTTSTTSTTGTTGTTGTGGTTGGAECDPLPVPPPNYIAEEVCFPLPDGLGSCEECVGDCLLPAVDGAITGDPLFCWADGLMILCGPDPEAEPGQCCYYAAYTGIVCEGRPLVVDGAVRAAPVRPRGDWLAEVDRPALAGVDAPTRAALALAWGEDARMEHASVASFARLVLHLMALAAPAELVSAAQAALGDEIGHARACFALASAYAGHPQGPGPLAIDGALARTPTLVELAVATVVEGCVGETIAASLARLAAAGARDPAAREVLAAIADDESRHAADAWRLVRWAIEVGGEPVRQAAREALAGALDRPPAARSVGGEVDLVVWEAHGRLRPAAEAAVIRGTLREVIEPCARALLGGAIAPERAATELFA